MKVKLFTRTLLLSLLISALLSFTACKSDEDKCKEGDLAACQQALAKGVLVDKRDGKMYKIVKIGSQTWMAENLNYKTQDSYCYDDNESNCSKYGRLYKWSATKKVCPNGWHLPNKTEFKILIKSTGGEKEFGINLKSKVGWDNGGKGTDAFGFSALPAGGRDDKGNYNFEGSLANFWSSTEVNSGDAYFIILNYGEDGAGLGYDYKYYGFSVRCLLDDSGLEKSAIDEPKTIGSKNSSTRTLVDKRDGKKYKTVKIGDQTWMAENLNYKTQHSYCYDDDELNCSKYGRLYTWPAAEKACPSGWHLPSIVELGMLLESVGGKRIAGNNLKSKNGWNKGGGGTDSFGFSALPAGHRINYGFYLYEDTGAFFWSSTEDDSRYAYRMRVDYSGDDVNLSDYDKGYAFSIRCLKD